MDFIVTNWEQIVVVILAVVGAASAITKLTPTPKDDKIVAKVKKVLDAIALNPKEKK